MTVFSYTTLGPTFGMFEVKTVIAISEIHYSIVNGEL
jgi:hypothetical protein